VALVIVQANLNSDLTMYFQASCRSGNEVNDELGNLQRDILSGLVPILELVQLNYRCVQVGLLSVQLDIFTKGLIGRGILVQFIVRHYSRWYSEIRIPRTHLKEKRGALTPSGM
jgi:hypothetical protein